MAGKRKKVLIGAAIGAGALVGAGLWWRRAARKRSLPCPPWLAGTILSRPWRLAPPSLDRLELAPGMRVLDVGCGPGRLAIPMAEAVGPGGEVVALDVQPEMLKKLEQRASDRRVANIRMVEADITRGGVEHEAFDRATLVTVLGEIPNREAALRAIFQALKPGGVLSITEVLPDPHFQRRRTVRRLASAAGFRERAAFGNPAAFTLNFERPAL